MKPSPLIRCSGTVVLPLRLFAPVAWYAALARYGRVCIDTRMRYDKRAKAVHRFDILSGEGRCSLTVPVSRPEGAFLAGNLRWNAVTVSAHGRWWETMPRTLATAYGRTPFFEYYIDRLMPLFAPRPLAGEGVETIAELCLRADAVVRAILGLDRHMVTEMSAEEPISAAEPMAADEVTDLRGVDFATVPAPAYYQLHADVYGFVSGLSVLDLIFNMGPEAPLLLAKY